MEGTRATAQHVLVSCMLSLYFVFSLSLCISLPNDSKHNVISATVVFYQCKVSTVHNLIDHNTALRVFLYFQHGGKSLKHVGSGGIEYGVGDHDRNLSYPHATHYTTRTLLTAPAVSEHIKRTLNNNCCH